MQTPFISRVITVIINKRLLDEIKDMFVTKIPHPNIKPTNQKIPLKTPAKDNRITNMSIKRIVYSTLKITAMIFHHLCA